MLKQPINFVYAAFAITLIGASFTMIILKKAYASYTEMYFLDEQISLDNNS